MKEIITLHCGVPHCNIHYIYEYSVEAIIAIAAEWRNEQSKDGDRGGLLPEPPAPGQQYELTINFPLQIDLAQPFRAVYFEPSAQHEGFKREADIDSIQFCLCKKINTLEINRQHARIKVEVLHTHNVTSDNHLPADDYERVSAMKKDISMGYADEEKFGKFSLVKASFEGDLGWMYIIEKKNGRSRIVAENQWDAHRDTWQMLNEEF